MKAPPPRTRRERETLAALDLGSNSFHMVIARVDAEGVHVLDDRREMVRLAEGLDARGRLDRRVEKRALDCLERFGAALRVLPRGAVRVVGTNALRKARNSRDFVRRAEALIGHRIDVVAGREEARLTYLGVASTDAPAKGERRLLVDIGGGSTECILGHGNEVQQAHSLYMGCVSFTERFFPRGRLKAAHFEAARTAAMIELHPFARGWRKEFDTAWGSSGTMRAIEAILVANGMSERGITPAGVAALIERMQSAKKVSSLELQALAPERAAVMPGGAVIVSAILDAFGIGEMRAARGAMREGILYDLIGRHAEADIRESSIRSFADRHGVDRAQAERVQQTALSLLRDVAGPWKLDLAEAAPYLRWAAMLHEIGQSLSYTGYHKHGAYLVRNASLAGLAREDGALIAALIGFHRRRPHLDLLEPLAPRARKTALRLAALLRIAVTLHRARAEGALPVSAVADGKRLTLRVPASWARDQTLSLDEIRQERAWIRDMGLRVRLVTA